MGRPRTSLRHALDRDVYQAVRKLIDDAGDGQRLDLSDVYGAIKRSNSSLKRRPKILLEDSIERVLAVLQEEAEVSSTSSEDSSRRQAAQVIEASNVMNRIMRKSMTPKAVPNEPELLSTTINGHRNASQDVDSRSIDGNNHTGRPVKRKRPTREATMVAPTHISLADIGGMGPVIEQLEESLVLPLLRPKRYIDRGLKIPRGILLHGPPGCGKTMLCEAIAATIGLPFLQIAAPAIVSGMSGESEKQLRQHFEKAIQMAPCLMFIDEIDAICPKRESAQREMERRIVAQLLTCMDDLALEKTNGKPVIVLAATNRPDSIDAALRRAGRFDTEINIGIPNPAVRESILRVQTRKTKVAEDVDFAKLAKMTPGFVGADLESLVYKAGSASNARYVAALKAHSSQKGADVIMKDEDPASRMSPAPASFIAMIKLLNENDEPEGFEDDAISMDDFLTALPSIQPSAKREGFATIPDTTWSDIGALIDVRVQLHDAIVEPIRRPEAYEKMGISIPAGVLLWGPPGCGKTLLAKAVANESRANFISIKGPELLNKYVGESERAVRQVFFRARSSVPCVIFFDELDAIVPRRDDGGSESSTRVVNTLLTELDGIGTRSGIYCIGATNRPDVIDPAMLRPGRLGQLLFVGLPGPDERVDILSTLLRKTPCDPGLNEFGRRCEGFSGADLSNLIYEGAKQTIRRSGDRLESRDFEYALGMVRPSVTNMDMYEKLKGRLRSRV